MTYYLICPCFFIKKKREKCTFFQYTTYLAKVKAVPASPLQCNSSCISTAHLVDFREALLHLFSQNNGLNFPNKLIA